jgi:putative membrane protein
MVMWKPGLFAVSVLAIVSPPMVASAQPAIPPPPKDFVMAAAQSDHYEIAAATVAKTQSHDPRVQAFAQDMIGAHTRTSEALSQAANAAGLAPLEPGMSSDQASLLASLQSLRGVDFDRAYAKQQVLAHTSALAVEQSFASSGAEPRLRQTAQQAVPTISNHLKMAELLQAQLGQP